MTFFDLARRTEQADIGPAVGDDGEIPQRRAQDGPHQRHRLAPRPPASDADGHPVAKLGDQLGPRSSACPSSFPLCQRAGLNSSSRGGRMASTRTGRNPLRNDTYRFSIRDIRLCSPESPAPASRPEGKPSAPALPAAGIVHVASRNSQRWWQMAGPSMIFDIAAANPDGRGARRPDPDGVPGRSSSTAPPGSPTCCATSCASGPTTTSRC